MVKLPLRWTAWLPAFVSPRSAARETPRDAIEDEPPHESGSFREPDLVELDKFDVAVKLDIRYATSDNFVGRAVYPEARAFLQRPAAEALRRANATLRRQGYGIVVFDGYRPWSVTKLFWDVTPPDKHGFVADPREGSRHNRGCAADVSLYQLTTGRNVPMPSEYDEMTERAYPDYRGGSDDERQARDLLRRTMEAEGFSVYRTEWWHFDYRDWNQYAILDVPFSVILQRQLHGDG